MTIDREREMATAIEKAETAEDNERDDAYARPKRPRRRAGDVYTFRLPSDRRDQLRRAAESKGMAPATLIREWVEARLDDEDRRSTAAKAVADLSDRLAEPEVTALRGAQSAEPLFDYLGRLFDDLAPVEPVPPLDFTPFRRALSDLSHDAGVVKSMAAATTVVQRRIGAALNELNAVNEWLVAELSETREEPAERESADDAPTTT